MKKALAVVLLICISLTFCFPSLSLSASAAPVRGMVNTSINSSQQTPVPAFDYEFLPASSKWLNYVSNENPATFSKDKIKYQLNSNVVLVDKSVTDSIASVGQLLSKSTNQKLKPNRIVAEGGYVPVSVLDTAAALKNRKIEPNTVVVDETTGTAFKVVSPTIYNGLFDADKAMGDLVKPLEGTYSITKPELHEVIDSFELQEDTIKLTRGNISGFAPKIEKNLILPNPLMNMDFDDSLKDFKYLSNNPLIKLQFTNEKLQGKLSDNSTIDVTLSGGLGIDGIDLTGRYSGFGGYRIEMTLKQESYLVVELDAEIKEEVCVPILGIDVPFGIGRVSGGVYAIIGMDGTIRLEIEAREFTATTIGVRGSTKFYAPTSFHPIFGNTLKTDGDVDLAGKINGYIKFGPMMGIEIFGFDLVGAGLFLGAGVKVEKLGKSLDVELYGIANIYIKIAGKRFNLMNYYPTILKRTQADTAGYRIKIMEAFLKPGRVGGVVKKEPDPKPDKDGNIPPPKTKTGEEIDEDGYIPAPNIEHRILVVPKGEIFNPDDPNSLNNDKIRKYPATGYAVTNDEGEFFKEDENMCYDGDKVYLEFKINGEPYFSDPVTPTLPFVNINLTTADYFNDFATGQVQPIRVIKWDAKPTDPPEKQYEYKYYNNDLIHISPSNHYITGGKASTMTDEYGNFDTRKPLVVSGKAIPNKIDIRPTVRDEMDFNILKWTLFDLTIDTHGTTHTSRIHDFMPTANFNFTRVIDELEGSYKRYQEGDKVIDQMVYDEYIWIENPLGTRTVTEAEFDYSIWGFSTQDYLHRFDDMDFSQALAAFTGENKWDTKPITIQSGGKENLTPVLDENGQPTGTALYSQRVTVEWVWQPHPNPVKITSDDHTQATTDGGTFQVTAAGFAPFIYSLKDAPDGVVIDKNTGLMSIPANLLEKDYTFTVHVEENAALIPAQNLPLGLSDKRKGNDPSPPDEQTFTLKITKESAPTVTPTQPQVTTQPTVTTQPSVTSQPTTTTQPSVTSQPTITIQPTITTQPSVTRRPTVTIQPPSITPVRTAPVLAVETHGYQFKKIPGGGDLNIQINATGSTPITYSLEVTNTRQSIPAEVSINPGTGALTVKEGIKTGQYFFTVKAANDVGSDLQDCRLDVTTMPLIPRPSITPRLPFSSDNTSNVMLLSAPSGSQPSIPSAAPVNSITIRCDHPVDVYTRDRFTNNGAAYIRWDSFATINVDLEKTFYDVLDTSPVSDQYHYVEQIDIPDSFQEKVKKSFLEKLSDYQRNDKFLGERLNTADLLKGFNDLRVNPLDIEMFDLEYGSLIDTMNKQKGGSFNVDLGGQSGTYVTGKYFAGLQNNKNASIAFRQEGAEVTFAGKDIKTSSEFDLFNFAYTDKAPHEGDILSGAGAGSENFTFGFVHHGELPGMATFSISTGMAEGTKVTVYKYNPQSREFSKVAGNLIVGAQGIVTYKNNTMSEYLVTTGTIPDAKTSSVFSSQDPDKRNYSWIFVSGAAIILAGLAAWLFLRKKKPAGN